MSIAQRWLPGGDKYEALKQDERRAFSERVRYEQEEILSILRSVVSTWTENEIEAGNEDEMLFQRFLDQHPEWDYENLYITIEAEMERVKLCWD